MFCVGPSTRGAKPVTLVQKVKMAIYHTRSHPRMWWGTFGAIWRHLGTFGDPHNPTGPHTGSPNK